ncbi:hypothetical protein U2F26_15730 [Micromonospora sp. 4G57]|uniref:Uncharacterized protein n=1 Tax=Micromonospora sicca TaxID=2202420 RepID=A0ABU5JA99_9ACTN|nr:MULTISPECIES: hypothetical protein [unclassified Micromonospora]MDZ5444173.1 hypothetical protein [Micromonospora sp. 4G57]MDZ5489473.1 hypothetical protein [Micromonospora sp. 4G53]
MSTGKFSEVDHDLLADYVGGALDGTPEQVRVARLVEEDPAWGGAYAALAPAVELVRADLADWAAAAVPDMPLALADRIAAALAGAGPAPTPASAEPLDAAGPLDTAGPVQLPMPSGPDGDGAEPVVGGRLRAAGHPVAASGTAPAQATGQRRTGRRVRPAEGPVRGSGPGRGRRRWARMAGPVALAAASLAAAGLGLNHLVASRNDTAVTADSAGAAGPLAAEPFRTTGPPRRSGTDYTPEQLSGASSLKAPPAAGGGRETGQAAPENERFSAAGGLDRLTGRDALDACLREITAEHGSGTVAVDLVDYASFQGRPALVVTFVDTAGARWAWVSGPECGVPGSGADTRFRTRVG